MYKYILLDLDETIWDFRKAEEIAFRETMTTHGIPVTPTLAEFYSVTNKSLWKALERKEVTKDELKSRRFELTYQKALEEAKGTGAIIPETTGEIVNATYMECLSHYGIMLDGAEEFLCKLDEVRAKNGIKVFYITNGIAYTAYGRIKDSGIDKHADGVFISELVGVEKPDKKYFDYVISEVAGDNADLSEFLVIGDSLSSDIQGAENSGINCCLYAHSGVFPADSDKHKIDYFAASYDELLAVIYNHI